MPTRSRSALVGIALLAAGCPSVTTLTSPDPLPPGKWQVGAALPLLFARDPDSDTRAALPGFELYARRGLSDDLDAGGKLYTFGAEADVKWRARRGRWPIALVPRLGWTRTSESEVNVEAFYLYGHFIAITGRPLSARWSVAFGPRLLYQAFWPQTGGFADGWSVGGFVTFDWRFGRRWHLVPELSLYRTVAGSEPIGGGFGALAVGLALDL